MARISRFLSRFIDWFQIRRQRRVVCISRLSRRCATATADGEHAKKKEPACNFHHQYLSNISLKKQVVKQIELVD